jgi:sugar phosphate isomerase/epimerase
MFKLAFSTVACPEWTLERVAQAAAAAGYDGVELRTFGSGSTQFACDPALTGPEKVRQIFFAAGVTFAPLATSVGFAEPLAPPILGRVRGDLERPIRLLKSHIALARAIGCPYVRVYGFELPSREKRRAGIHRVVERLALAADAIANMGVRLVLENGGSFPTARSLLEVIERLGNPLVGAAYSLPVAAAAGEDPTTGIALLGPSLWVVKAKDLAGGTPCLPGDGEVPLGPAIRSLVERDYGGWVVFEWDRAWLRGLQEPDVALPEAARRIFAMAGAPAAVEAPPQLADITA